MSCDVAWQVTTVTYETRMVHVGGEWAVVSWHSDKTMKSDFDEPDGMRGTLMIHSSCGNYCNHWPAIGETRFEDFLRGLEFTYFMEKTQGRRYMEFDWDATRKGIAGVIEEYETEFGKNDELLLELDSLALGIMTEGELGFELHGSTILEEVFNDDMSAVPWQYSPRGECVTFWEKLWPVIKSEVLV